MLDEKDLHTIQELIDCSEARMQKHMEEMISCSEVRMQKHMEEMISRSESRMVAYFESAIIPKFNLLADGHKLLQETLVPRTRVEELEDEVALMRQAIASITRDIAKLKKAQ